MRLWHSHAPRAGWRSRWLILLWAALLLCPGAFAQNSGGRLESEFKLDVPPEQSEQLWEYLNTAYGKEGRMLKALGPDFSAKFSVEGFADRYFDDPELSLMERKIGLRHRSRVIIDGADHRKDGRQLVQLKLSGEDAVLREEVKFEVRDHPEIQLEPGDNLVCVGLVKRSQREAFLATLRKAQIDPRRLRVAATLLQTRSRAYISRGGQPFATITLDEVATGWWYPVGRFVEVEMELNEINYTASTEAQRESQLRINEMMRGDLLKNFPNVHQDQTPKYNKAMDIIRRRTPALALSLALGFPVELLLLLGLALTGPLWIYRRLRKRRPELGKIPPSPYLPA